MSMEMLATLLRELLRDVRALQARASVDGLPGAITQRAAAKLLGCRLATLEKEIRQGRIRTVSVAGEELVPLSEIAHFNSLEKGRARGATARPGRRTSGSRSANSGKGMKRKSKGRPPGGR